MKSSFAMFLALYSPSSPSYNIRIEKMDSKLDVPHGFKTCCVKEFLTRAFSFCTSARSSAAVLHPLTPLIKSLSLVDISKKNYADISRIKNF